MNIDRKIKPCTWEPKKYSAQQGKEARKRFVIKHPKDKERGEGVPVDIITYIF